MMSQKQVAANRRNAEGSTGPTSARIRPSRGRGRRADAATLILQFHNSLDRANFGGPPTDNKAEVSLGAA
jgi:hypothetical protein